MGTGMKYIKKTEKGRFWKIPIISLITLALLLGSYFISKETLRVKKITQRPQLILKPVKFGENGSYLSVAGDKVGVSIEIENSGKMPGKIENKEIECRMIVPEIGLDKILPVKGTGCDNNILASGEKVTLGIAAEFENQGDNDWFKNGRAYFNCEIKLYYSNDLEPSIECYVSRDFEIKNNDVPKLISTESDCYEK